MAVEGVHRGAVLAHGDDRPGPGPDRRGPVPDRVPLAQDVPGQHLRRPSRDRHPRDERDRPGPLGHQGQGARPAGLEAAGRRIHDSRCDRTPARCFGATPAETGERARRFADQGFTAVKFGWDPMGQDAGTDVALVREARAGLGTRRRPDDRRRPRLRRQDGHPAHPCVRALRPVLVRGAAPARRLRGLRQALRGHSAADRRRRGGERAEVVPPAHGRRQDRRGPGRPDALRRLHRGDEDRRAGRRPRPPGGQSRLHHLPERRRRTPLPGEHP